jgi:hypothetical protein
VSNKSSIVPRIFVAAATFSPSCCLATIWRYTYRHTDCCEGFVKHAAEMVSGAMIYIYIYIYTKFNKNSFCHSKVNKGDTEKHRQHDDRISLLLIFQKKEIRPKIKVGFWTLAAFSVSSPYTQSVGLLGRGISPLQDRYLHIEQHKHRINTSGHPCLEWDSNPRSQRSTERRQFTP